MKRNFAFFLVMLILVTSGCGQKTVLAHKQTVNKYSNSNINLIINTKNVNIQIDSGNLTVYSWDNLEVGLEVTHTVRDNFEKEELEEYLNKFSIEKSIVDNTLFINVKYNGKLKNTQDYYSDIKLTIPRAIKNLKIYQTNGSIIFQDKIMANIYEKLGAVNTEIKGMVGLLTVNCEEGNVRLNSGKLLNSSSVSIKRGNINILSECEKASQYTFQTQTGNVYLMFPVSADIKLESTGTVQSNQFTGIEGSISVKAVTQIGKISVKGY